MLKNLCDQFGLREFVSKPTRGDYLLDLVLASGLEPKTKICGKMSDHACIQIDVPDSMEVRKFPPRFVWKFSDANWHGIEHALGSQDWHALNNGSIDDALAFFNGCLNNVMRMFIPGFWKPVDKSSVPWLNEACRAAIAHKHASVNTPAFEQRAEECAEVLRATCAKYLVKLKSDMSKLPRSSKRWWTLNKQLLHRQAAPSLFPS